MEEYRTLTPQERLDALCWAANKAGQSYGKFSTRLTQSEKEDIYEQYRTLLLRREKRERERLKSKEP